MESVAAFKNFIYYQMFVSKLADFIFYLRILGVGEHSYDVFGFNDWRNYDSLGNQTGMLFSGERFYITEYVVASSIFLPIAS